VRGFSFEPGEKEALIAFLHSLTDEEARHVREQLTEEELVVFDLLTRPGPELSTEERNEVKKVARQLLAKLNGVLTIDWQKTAQARARVRDAIEAELDDGLPRAYSPDVFKAKAGAVFQHVYDKYARVA
jgi:type I restriction enzyme R subunit